MDNEETLQYHPPFAFELSDNTEWELFRETWSPQPPLPISNEQHASSPASILDMESSVSTRNHDDRDIKSDPKPDRGCQARSQFKFMRRASRTLDKSRKLPDWQPFWLRRSTLVALSILFVAISASLFGLWVGITKQNGLDLITTNHYSWKYGPTAILVFVVSLWRQVDYYSKLLQPWKNMQRGPTSAKRSVLLDYVSQWQVTAFVDAVRFRDVPVAMSLSGFSLLKLLVIFSTTLLVSIPTSISQENVPVTLSTRFDARKWNASFQWSLYPSGTFGSEKPNISVTRPVYHYYGVQHGNLESPDGYKDGIAFQPFELVDGSYNATKMTASVRAFVPATTCEEAIVTVLPYDTNGYTLYPNDVPDAPPINLVVDSATCHLGHDNWNRLALMTADPGIDLYPTRAIATNMVWVNCSIVPPQYSSLQEGAYNASYGDFRYALTVADISYDFLSPHSTNRSRRVLKVAVVLCSIEYNMRNIPLISTYSDHNTLLDVSPGAPDTTTRDHLPGLTNTQLTNGITILLMSTTDMFFENSTKDSLGPRTLFHLVDMDIGRGGITFESLLNATAMREAAQKVLNGLSSMYALENFILQEKSNSTGTLIYTEDRLHVRMSSLILMVVCLFIMALVSMILLVVRPFKVVTQSPDSIEVITTTSLCNKEACSAFTKLGHRHDTELREHLHKYEFHTSTTCASSIKPREIGVTATKKEPNEVSKFKKRRKKEWVPLAMTYPMLCLAIGLPVAAIGALEILHRITYTQNGLRIASNDFVGDSFFYGTALILLLITALFNSLEYTISQFSPFSTLYAVNASAKRTTRSNLVRRVPLVSLWKALRQHHFGSALLNLATLIGPILTIVSSGLWFTDYSVIVQQNIRIQRLDTWNTTWPDSNLSDGGAALTLSMLQNEGLKFPRGTWEELAFPQIGEFVGNSTRLSSVSIGDNEEQSYNITLPALRANLDCIQVPYSKINISWLSSIEYSIDPIGTHAYGHINASFDVPLPKTCLASLPNNLTPINYTYRLDNYITWGIWNEDSAHNYLSSLESYIADLQYLSIRDVSGNEPHGCPSLVFVFGYIKINSTLAENITAFTCHQQLQEVQTSVPFLQAFTQGVPNQASINDKIAPVINESSTQLLTNGTTGITSFPFHIETNLRKNLQSNDLQSTYSLVRRWGPFFDNILDSIDGKHSPEDFMGPAKAEKLKVAINHLYRKYMAQVINVKMRQAISSEDHQTFSGTADVRTLRVKMDSTSKLLLQILLGVMVFCGVVACLLVKVRGVLPYNPGTIAGCMSLVVGSRWLEEMKSGREEPGKILSENAKFRLGWWKDGKLIDGNGREEEEGVRFGIDIIMDDDKTDKAECEVSEVSDEVRLNLSSNERFSSILTTL